jgi:cell division protein FtsA
MLAELVVTGGGASLEGIDSLASEFFDLPARVGTPMHVGGLTETIKNPAYATAVGLVLFGAKLDSGTQIGEKDRKGLWSRVTSWFSI